MPKRKVNAAQNKQPWLSEHLPKVLAGLLATGALGGTGASYMSSQNAGERTAVAETKILHLEQDAGAQAKDLKKIDRRTIRIEEHMHAISEKLGIKRAPGPEEE